MPGAPDPDLPVVVLCGGRGTRLGRHAVPKPLVEVGGVPIVRHVVGIYAAAGLRRFVLACGFRAGDVEREVARGGWPAGVEVRCVDTGLDTPTGGRVHRLREELPRGCHLTYADGVADVDVAALETAHRASGHAATITVVRPELPFGFVDLAAEDGVGDAAGSTAGAAAAGSPAVAVRGFDEKPRSDRWVNGGFMRLEPEAINALEDDAVLEREPLERLAAAGRLGAHRHEGFWACMDTYKDALALNDLWDAGRAPWAAPPAGARGVGAPGSAAALDAAAGPG